MIVELERLIVNGTKVAMLRVEGLIKLGESAEFFLSAFRLKPVWNGNVVVDVEKIDYIDSTGIGEFVAVCVNLARQGQNVVLLQPHDSHPWATTARVDRAVRVGGAIDDLRVFRTEEDALEAVVASEIGDETSSATREAGTYHSSECLCTKPASRASKGRVQENKVSPSVQGEDS